LREKPDFTHIKRWRKAIPQYELGYEKNENGIEDFENEKQRNFLLQQFLQRNFGRRLREKRLSNR
jgi:hypothetical protein